MADYSQSFGHRVLALRQRKGLKQSDLAEILGYRKSAISQWESGISTPSFAALCNLADYFQVSLDYLTGRSNAMKLQDFVSKTMAAIKTGAGENHWHTVHFDVTVDINKEEVEIASHTTATATTRLTFDITDISKTSAATSVATSTYASSL